MGVDFNGKAKVRRPNWKQLTSRLCQVRSLLLGQDFVPESAPRPQSDRGKGSGSQGTCGIDHSEHGPIHQTQSGIAASRSRIQSRILSILRALMHEGSVLFKKKAPVSRQTPSQDHFRRGL